MPNDEYSSAPSTGKLKLKGVTNAKIDKKRKKKSKSKESGAASGPDDLADNSLVSRQLEDEDTQLRKEKRRNIGLVDGKVVEPGAGVEDEDFRQHLKTDAERRYEEQRRKRLEERLKREGVKTHKERVEELNKYLSGLSEHHDMPRIGPG